MNDKKRKEFLAYATLPLFKKRVRRARDIVSQWLSICANPYVAFSTGKDSTCVLALVREQSESPSVYFDADSSYPESQQLLSAIPNLIIWPATEPILATIKRVGFASPRLEDETMRTTVYEPAAALLEKYKFDGVAYGLRAEESYGRRVNRRVRGPLFQYQTRYPGVWACQPICDWSYYDVWAFIVSQDLSYCGVYDKLWDEPIENQRISYWAGESERANGRYARLRRYYPALWQKLISEIPEAATYA